MKQFSFVFCLISVTSIFCASSYTNEKFRKHVLLNSCLAFPRIREEFDLSKKDIGSPEYQKRLKAIFTEVVDFRDLVYSGRTYYYEEVGPEDMMQALQDLKGQKSKVVQNFLQETEKIKW